MSDTAGVKLLLRPCSGFNHTEEHKFRQHLSDSSGCICSDADEKTEHFFIWCHNLTNTCSLSNIYYHTVVYMQRNDRLFDLNTVKKNLYGAKAWQIHIVMYKKKDHN